MLLISYMIFHLCAAHVVKCFREIWHVTKVELEQFHLTQCKKKKGVDISSGGQQRARTTGSSEESSYLLITSGDVCCVSSATDSVFDSLLLTVSSPPLLLYCYSVTCTLCEYRWSFATSKAKGKENNFSIFTPGLNTTPSVNFTPRWLTEPCLWSFSHSL